MADETTKRIEAGMLVKVRMAYQGDGKYAPDGYEGTHTVLRPSGEHDWYLARGDQRRELEWADWFVIIHESRLTPVE